jgi:RNA polymerase sigma factor (TIGR02999 family)
MLPGREIQAENFSMPPEQLTELSQSEERGDAPPSEELFAALYEELHRLARRELRRNVRVTLSPTTLLHETYLSLSSGRPAAFPDRARFLAYASRAMRGLLVDYLRRGQAQKRGGLFEITSLPTELPEAGVQDDIEGIGEALNRLGDLEPRLAQIVDLKFFCGFSFEEIASLLDVSTRTVQRDWDKARILLQRDLGEG